MLGAAGWRDRLSHVFWIGGPPDAGKSTVADLLGEWFDVQLYNQDRHEMSHIRRADPARHPLHIRLRERLDRAADGASFQQSWVEDTPDELARSARANWTERIGMVCDDFAAMAPHLPIVAEGPGFFPDVIGPVLPAIRHAIWLIPTDAFKRASHERRDKSAWRFDTSDPDLAQTNHIQRDLLFMDMFQREVIAANLPWIEVDGSEDAEAVARRVADHFGFHGAAVHGK